MTPFVGIALIVVASACGLWCAIAYRYAQRPLKAWKEFGAESVLGIVLLVLAILLLVWG